MKMIKYPRTEQFRTVIKQVTKKARFNGYDEEAKEVIWDKDAKLPTLGFHGTTKIHGCFEKNTKVMMSNGEEVSIKDMKKGDYILSYNFKTNEQETKKVTKVVNQDLKKEWCKLIFDKTEIICTKDHKIWTENRGYVEAQNLTSEDIFKTAY